MKIERIDARAFEDVADRPDISLGGKFADPGHVDGYDVIVRNPLRAVLDGAVIQIRQRQVIEIPTRRQIVAEIDPHVAHGRKIIVVG